MTEIEENLFDEFWKTYNRAAREGFARSTYPLPATERLIIHNNAVFAAFKVHRMQNDMVALLLDENGRLKPFDEWLKDVRPIASHQCRHWLRTEYDTAVLRAHQAADWQQFQREKDVLPNLKWMPSTSIHPGADHKIFWGVIRPVDDPFWDEHRPGDRWNCKCTLSSTDDPATELPDIPEENPVEDNPHAGLDNNPGKDGKLFSDTHPYIADAYKGARKVVERFVGEVEGIIPPHAETYADEYKGKVLCSPLHGKDEKKENVDLAKFVAKKLGTTVYLLPRLDITNKRQADLRDELLPDGVKFPKNPDFMIDGKLFDGKSMMGLGRNSSEKTIKNAIENHIKKAKKQADNVILEIPSFVPRKQINKTIYNYIGRSKKDRIIIVKYKNKLIIYKKRGG